MSSEKDQEQELKALRDWLIKEHAWCEMKIRQGKGTWPEADYVRDEDWARLMGRRNALDEVLVQLTRAEQGDKRG